MEIPIVNTNEAMRNDTLVTNSTNKQSFEANTFCELIGYSGGASESDKDACSLNLIMILGLTFTVITIVIVSLIAIIVKRS